MKVSQATALLCAVLLAAPGFGQSSASQQSTAKNDEKSFLRVVTRLVQVSVIAEDSKGQPVENLRREDFSLLDNNTPQPVSEFSMQTSRATSSFAVPLPEHVYSNRVEQQAGVPTSATVILLDNLNTKFNDQSNARWQMVKLLGRLRPQDRVAVYVLSTKLTVLQDFSSDSSALLRALTRYEQRDSLQLAASEFQVQVSNDPAVDAFLNAANQNMGDVETISRATTTADALEGIANHLVRLSGRKSLLWVTGGFPIDLQNQKKVNTSQMRSPLAPQSHGSLSPGSESIHDIYGTEMSVPGSLRDPRTFNPEIRRAIRALNSANVSVYPVDSRGLVGAFGTDPNFNAAGTFQGTRMNRANITTLEDTAPIQDTMLELADGTGGRAFYNTNDVAGSIRQAMDDSRLTYMLGYYPTHNQWDGNFREIKVQVNKPGLRLRYRKGYFALAQQQDDPQVREALLREALSGALDFTSIGLTIHTSPLTLPEGHGMRLDLVVASHDITLETDNDRWAGSLDVYYLQLAPDGKQIASDSRAVNMRLTADTHEALRKNGLSLTHSLAFEEGATQVRIVVRDSISGNVGSLTIPFRRTMVAPR